MLHRCSTFLNPKNPNDCTCIPLLYTTRLLFAKDLICVGGYSFYDTPCHVPGCCSPALKDKLVKHVWRAQAIKSKKPRLVAFYPTWRYTYFHLTQRPYADDDDTI